MIQNFVYAGHSGVLDTGTSRSIRLAANISREPVAFSADLTHPLRFREAISALHDVVVSDLRFEKRDKSAYEEWKQQEVTREQSIRRQALQEQQLKIAERMNIPLPDNFETQYQTARADYWRSRDRYSNYIRKHDPDLWRKLVPCDPIITIAPDVVLFECFSKDESAYGCLRVDRTRGFGSSSNLQLGTTNVDYSQSLFDQFQTLRTYRPTRFDLDPQGFTVDTGQANAHREEKIDLPTSWLRGFTKLQSAMTMPTTRLTLPREVVYSLLAFLKRNIARKCPRAMRFELEPGKPIRIVLEPWGKVFEAPTSIYSGPETQPIRIWGTRRLLVLARTLPLADAIDVHLLATGLPSFWVVRMQEMTFTLGLSGWTTNDWSSGSALDLLQPPRAPSVELVDRVAAVLKQNRQSDSSTIGLHAGERDALLVLAALRHLAGSGQVIYDLADGQFRYRQIMSQVLGETQLGLEDDELTAARKLIDSSKAELLDRQDGPKLMRVLVGKVESKPVEVLVDVDDRIKRGKCLCGHYKQFGLRNGPCRHMIALRWIASRQGFEAMQQTKLFNTQIGLTQP
jgi:hypothetical protein